MNVIFQIIHQCNDELWKPKLANIYCYFDIWPSRILYLHIHYTNRDVSMCWLRYFVVCLCVCVFFPSRFRCMKNWNFLFWQWLSIIFCGENTLLSLDSLTVQSQCDGTSEFKPIRYHGNEFEFAAENRFRLLQFHPNLSQLAWHVFIAFERTAVKWLDIRACWLDEGFLRKELTFFGLAIFVRRICAYRVKLPSIREKCGCFLTKGSNIQCS